jgi:RNA polymerase sigma-70 factor, ECF subfamily
MRHAFGLHREMGCRSHPRAVRGSTVQDSILAAAPRLRSYALSLCGSSDQADDLVQETLLRAMTKIGSFQPGTNLWGWLTTILRNVFLSELRKRRREVEDVDDYYVGFLTSVPQQESQIDFCDFRAALAMLPLEQQEALILVGALGLPCQEAAAICGTPVATIRSRIHRARSQLAILVALSD